MATSYAFSDSLEQEILNVFFKAAAVTHGTFGVWVALSTSTLTDASTGASMNEMPSANGYTRATVTFGTPLGGVATNSTTATFTCSSSAWPAATMMALVDRFTFATGNLLMYDDIADATLNPGDTLTFAPGQITISVL